jgi:hypothetical protein
LNGDSGVGWETIQKLCAAWDIDEVEFIRLDATDLNPEIAALRDRLKNIGEYIAKMVPKK